MHWLALILILPYLYLLTRVYISLRKIKPFFPSESSGIFVSVIVPCRNEEKNIPLLLSDLVAQDYDPALIEIMIIDDNSTDSTLAAAYGFPGISDLKIFKNKGSGKKSAIRTGVEVCSGELIITTDADCRVGSRWISSITSFCNEHHPELIIGPVVVKGKKGFLHRFQELEFSSLQGITAGTAASGNPVMCNGANLAFTKEVYRKYSSFLHEELVSGDDVFLLHAIKRNSHNSVMWLESADAAVTTSSKDSWKSFISQRARWISKAGSYTDSYTIILAIVTFVTILVQLFMLVAGIIDSAFLAIFAAAFVLKSIPDFLILKNTTSRYEQRNLIKWFLPSQIVYSFYILSIVPGAIFKRNSWK
jgi:poly-beta-1,6-N-acetyl-D-glucosamine synthase